MHRTSDYRQHQNWKYRKKVERIVDLWDSKIHTWTPEEKEKQIQRSLKARKRCSRSCCGNPRKWSGRRTYQELKADVEFEEELNSMLMWCNWQTQHA